MPKSSTLGHAQVLSAWKFPEGNLFVHCPPLSVPTTGGLIPKCAKRKASVPKRECFMHLPPPTFSVPIGGVRFQNHPPLLGHVEVGPLRHLVVSTKHQVRVPKGVPFGYGDFLPFFSLVLLFDFISFSSSLVWWCWCLYHYVSASVSSHFKDLSLKVKLRLIHSIIHSFKSIFPLCSLVCVLLFVSSTYVSMLVWAQLKNM